MHSPSKNQDSPPQAPSLKEQLDQKADESRARENGNEESLVEKVVHKITQAIPAAVPILGGSNPEGKVEDEGEAGPPNRPEHDVQIEEFVREQHRSKFAGEEVEGSKS